MMGKGADEDRNAEEKRIVGLFATTATQRGAAWALRARQYHPRSRRGRHLPRGYDV
jgi:hypothetical protein